MVHETRATAPVSFSRPRLARKCHYRKIPRIGFRERCIAKGWHMKGAYAERWIRGVSVMQTIAQKGDDFYLCRFQRKSDFWASITAHYSENMLSS